MWQWAHLLLFLNWMQVSDNTKLKGRFLYQQLKVQYEDCGKYTTKIIKCMHICLYINVTNVKDYIVSVVLTLSRCHSSLLWVSKMAPQDSKPSRRSTVLLNKNKYHIQVVQEYPRTSWDIRWCRQDNFHKQDILDLWREHRDILGIPMMSQDNLRTTGMSRNSLWHH